MQCYGIIFLCFGIGIQIYAAEQPTRAIIEWDAKLSATNDTVYKQLIEGYLKDYPINFTDKYVLDVCCGTGYISEYIAQKARPDGLVVGIDQSHNMVKWANATYGDTANLSFQQCFAQEFKPFNLNNKFNVVTLFNSFDLIDDKLELCKQIHSCLRAQGEFLVNVGSGTEPLDIQVTREMIENIPLMGYLLSSYGLNAVLNNSYVTEQQYKDIFTKAGFDIVSFVKKTGTFVFKDEEAFAAIKRPIALSRPIVQSVPSWIFEYVFNQFVTRFLTRLEKNDDGHYLCPVEEILVHARKSEKK